MGISDHEIVESVRLLKAGTDPSSTTRDHSMSSDDETYFPTKRERRPTIRGRVLALVGMNKTRRRWESEPTPSQRGTAPDAKSRAPREARTCRKGRVCKLFKRAVIALPVLALMGFGVLHILQALLGASSLLLNLNDDDAFMPNYGKPGQLGADLDHYPTDATRDVLPIKCHSHNDYWRRVPLFDAIHWGCTGVEADVWLYDDELYVGHSTASLTKTRTLRNLYIDPLVGLLDSMNPSNEFSNTTGRGVFDEDPKQTLILLIDFKTSGHETFTAVSAQLQALRDKGYLTHYNGTAVVSRAITIVATGNTPFDSVTANTTYRDIFFDAPLDRMWQPSTSDPTSDITPARLANTGGQGTVGTSPTTTFNSTNSYYASVSFHKAVGFVWFGHPSAAQMSIIRGVTRGAHAKGLKVRWWDTPAWPVSKRNKIWSLLVREGADMLNVDDLRAAATQDWRRRVHNFFD